MPHNPFSNHNRPSNVDKPKFGGGEQPCEHGILRGMMVCPACEPEKQAAAEEHAARSQVGWTGLSDNYVAVMEIRRPDGSDWYVGVRGGQTTGHWSEREAGIVGERLQNEIAGRYCGILMVGTWEAWANPRLSTPGPVTVAEYFALTLAGQDPDRTTEQYKTDPLVTGVGLEV